MKQIERTRYSAKWIEVADRIRRRKKNVAAHQAESTGRWPVLTAATNITALFRCKKKRGVV